MARQSIQIAAGSVNTSPPQNSLPKTTFFSAKLGDWLRKTPLFLQKGGV
jgi:hypothetical protein